MSILDHCLGGTLLERPKPLESAPDPSLADDLRSRILDGCLPAQREFVTDESHRILGYIGGFGSGKSYALARKLIWLGMLNPNQTLMACKRVRRSKSKRRSTNKARPRSRKAGSRKAKR